VILVIDNYDSFTFNLVQLLQTLGAEVETRRNDAVDVAAIAALAPSRLVISPGPCTPNEAGVSLGAVRAFSGVVPILGVCLGCQAIGQAFGARIVRAGRPMHGKTSTLRHDGESVFAGVAADTPVGRYHSLVIDRSSAPECLEVLATAADDGEIMAVRHREHPTVGVQFHPESILTPQGPAIVRNFLMLESRPAL
jgi:anthranilate synthase/aminodeoxychorismate synthase-like glutamine amidotransferase